MVSADALAQIRASGLGLENMNVQEIDELMAGEYDEDDLPSAMPPSKQALSGNDSAQGSGSARRGARRVIEQDEEEAEQVVVPATQAPRIARRDGKVSPCHRIIATDEN
jgi:hypothetical protein